MKKFLLFFFNFIFPSILFAQFVGNGFYRVKNRDTHRYLTVVDNRAYINVATTEPDLAAILPIKDFDRIVGNPASIIYIEKVKSNDYVLTAQNVNTYDLVGEYLKLRETSDGSYYAYATAKGMTKYLCDEQSSYDEGWLMTGTTMRNWNIIPVSSDTENYFAAVPEFEYNGKYYTTMYASFSYKAKNTNTELYYVADIVKNVAVIKKLDASSIVPALTPIVIKCSSSDYANNKLDVVESSSSALSGNRLGGVLFNNDNKKHLNRVAYDPNTMRVLGLTKDGSIGFVTADIDYLPANKAYLTVPAGSPSELKMVTEDELSLLPDDVTPSDAYTIHTNDQTIIAGVDAILPVYLKNTKEIKSIEFELSLSQGISVKQGLQNKYLVDVNANRVGDYTLDTKLASNGNVIVSVVSASNNVIKADSGLIANVTLNVDRNIKVGQHTVAIKNIILDKADNEKSISVSDTASVFNAIPYDQGNIILYTSEHNVNAGVESVLPIYMKNTEQVTSFEFELCLPNGFSVKEDENGNYIVDIERSSSHGVVVSQLENGNLKISSSSESNTSFEGEDGVLAYVTIQVDENLSLGQYSIGLKNVVLTLPEKNNVTIPYIESSIEVKAPLLGDFNSDGHITLEDVYYIIKLWLGDGTTYSSKIEDINSDGKFNVVDISAIVNLFLGNQVDGSGNDDSGEYSSMTIERISINPGQTIDVPVQFSNSGIDFISAEFDLYLPEGVEIATLANNKPAITAGSRLTDHEIITRKNTDGSIKIAVYSLTNSVFAQQEGDILILSLRATENAEEGLYALELNNQILATSDIRAMKADDHLTIVNITRETRIDELNQTIDTKVVYDLQGRRSSVKQHGVYIVNGKKVIK